MLAETTEWKWFPQNPWMDSPAQILWHGEPLSGLGNWSNIFSAIQWKDDDNQM